ncbi:hypothetical protein MNEG_7908 [Monoraphidium neglectum]|uniref:Uncharacterized protein n=1 Tax=Monoraphidium neglectum TaxID=145388 RepID=A0A0D2KXS1_9CHLO|nr:hypothetical protein MNEG_7908 [Monoraphidium neglectum]KIZ00054.1 hypothetical protein MNEG_7908 [Monoraphidium neglectum]|eukprot:XP_013899073.1 hypothetical protein MNEG_7908 [Monoraphidium neglectum]
MRLAAFAVVAALLVGSAAAWGGYTQPAFPIPKRNVTVKTLNNNLINQGTIRGFSSLPGKLVRGEFVVKAPGKATPKVEVKDVGCLNTKIPAPLNWGPLWCAGREAKVHQWVDEVGSIHRTVDIPAQPNVTANMVFWLFSPMYPQYLEFEGKMWFWYHLWHPLDHIMASNMIAPSTANIGTLGLYTLIHEHYRNLPGQENLTEFETDTWFHVEDLVSNFLKKRIVITVNTAGLQAWTLTVNFKDTPQGLKIDNELIMGAAPVGYDPEDPSKGAPAEAAVIVNENLVKKTFDDYAPGGNVPGSEFTRSLNAITRHVVEEFSMFRFFLPQVWHRFPHLQGMFAVGDAIGSFVPRLNYGPFMTSKAPNVIGLTELMMPFNRTALTSVAGIKKVASAIPGALATGLTLNANSQIAGLTKSANTAIAAVNTFDPNTIVKTAVKLAIPSAVGEYSRKGDSASRFG